jgi:hypothetical protein
MAVHTNLPARSIALLWRVPVAVSRECPRPPSQHHHGLQIVVPGIALGNRTIVALIVVDLATGHGATGDEVCKRLLGERSGLPLTVVTGLPFLGGVDAEQPHKLGSESHGIAIYDLKTGF